MHAHAVCPDPGPPSVLAPDRAQRLLVLALRDPPPYAPTPARCPVLIGRRDRCGVGSPAGTPENFRRVVSTLWTVGDDGARPLSGGNDPPVLDPEVLGR